MAWGLGVGLLIIGLIFAIFALIIFKETRTHRFWRRKVEEGDLEMIRQLVQAEIDQWRRERPPKGVPARTWQGIQSVELVDLGADFIHASTTAEPQFAQVGGDRRLVSSAIDEGKRITGRLAERLFYDVPHVRPDRLQIDIYSTFQVDAAAEQRCIISTVASREVAADLDWDDEEPEAIAELLGARYEVDASGSPVPFDPDSDPARGSTSGRYPASLRGAS